MLRAIPAVGMLILLSFGSPLAADEAQKSATRELPPALKRVLDAHNIDAQHISVHVQSLRSDEPLLALNGSVARNPASTIKLLSTYLALDYLGPAYTWKTEIFTRGPILDGVLDGDLIIKGYGDPYIVLERLWLMIRELRQRGLKQINGNLVVDNSYFQLEESDPAEFDGQEQRTYNVAPEALMVNFQTVRFVFRPTPDKQQLKITADPQPDNLEIINRLQLRSGYCGGYQNGIRMDMEKDQVIFSGSYPRECRQYGMSRAVLTPASYAWGVFRKFWRDSGGDISGSLVLGEVPETMEPFAVIQSPSLAELIRGVNKFSNNIMARHMTLTVGAEMYGAPGTTQKSRDAVGALLKEAGRAFPELYIDNGAGLSRDTRITAEHLADVLRSAADSIYQAEFIASLSISGMDGTLRKQYRNEPTTGRMHLKTGRLEDVFAVAGYVVADSGERFVVIMLQNYPKAHRGIGQEAQDALLRWVYEH